LFSKIISSLDFVAGQLALTFAKTSASAAAQLYILYIKLSNLKVIFYQKYTLQAELSDDAPQRQLTDLQKNSIPQKIAQKVEVMQCVADK
jgi:hypothetical protein